MGRTAQPYTSPSHRLRRAAGLCAGVLALTTCTRGLDLIERPDVAVITTNGPWASMAYLARTDSGVIAIDLGWTGAEEKIVEALGELGATPHDVRYVFLTHAHRDHIHAWPLVRQARFVMGAAEVPYFTGMREYQETLPRLGDQLVEPQREGIDSLDIVPVAGDTAFVLGRDTLYAYPVPGHTPGSTAYLLRQTLFGGDAINWRPLQGFAGARPEFSEDVNESRASMRALWARLGPDRVRIVCSAHAKCAVADSGLREATVR